MDSALFRDMNWRNSVIAHYQAVWGAEYQLCDLPPGPIDELPSDFGVAKFPPRLSRADTWTYATIGMSRADDEAPIELHILSPIESDRISTLLTVTAHYHRTGARLDLWHSVNFGAPWLNDSKCDRGYVSLPYLDGPKLENLHIGGAEIKCYWLIPATAAEVEFKQEQGPESLEQVFEAKGFNYLDPLRESVV